MELDTAASIYVYRDFNLVPLFVGLTARGVRRQHEISESKVWWPLVGSCNIEHYATKLAADARESVLLDLLSPVFNTDDKFGALLRYYGLDEAPKQVDSSHAEVRRLRLRWRQTPNDVRRSSRCIRCETNLALELLDGSCAICNYLDRYASNSKRLDGKTWGNNTSKSK